MRALHVADIRDRVLAECLWSRDAPTQPLQDATSVLDPHDRRALVREDAGQWRQVAGVVRAGIHAAGRSDLGLRRDQTVKVADPPPSLWSSHHVQRNVAVVIAPACKVAANSQQKADPRRSIISVLVVGIPLASWVVQQRRTRQSGEKSLGIQAAIKVALLGSALTVAPTLAQNMALTPNPQPLSGPSPPEHRRILSPPRAQAQVPGGELTNQRTGPMRQRVVRDICIGCDR